MSLLDVFWAMLLLALLAAWLLLLVAVFTDIFDSEDLSRWGRASWLLGTALLPYLGAVAYVVVRGNAMQARALARKQRDAERQAASYIQGVASTPSASEELARLAQLRDTGALTPEEFAAQKARILAA